MNSTPHTEGAGALSDEPRSAAATASIRPQREPGDEEGSRGTLTVRDRVAQRLAVRAALDTPNVQPRTGGLDKLTGQSLPHVQLAIAANRVTAQLKIAVAWPAPVIGVARAVQHNVADALSTLGGLDVHRVDVAVTHLSPPAATQQRVQ